MSWLHAQKGIRQCVRKHYKVLANEYLCIYGWFLGTRIQWILPQILSNKYSMSTGIIRIDGGEKIWNLEMDANSRKAIQIIELMKQYRELALTARDAGKFLGRRAEISWETGNENLVEWSERKGDGMHPMVELYEEGVIKLKRRLHRLIQTSDGLLTLNVKWEDVEILGLPFHRILSGAICLFPLWAVRIGVLRSRFLLDFDFECRCCSSCLDGIDVRCVLLCVEDKIAHINCT